jgi:hypothetical protein
MAPNQALSFRRRGGILGQQSHPVHSRVMSEINYVGDVLEINIGIPAHRILLFQRALNKF